MDKDVILILASGICQVKMEVGLQGPDAQGRAGQTEGVC